MARIKQWLDGPTLKLFSIPWVGRIMDYLSYQHKRVRRRQLMARLEAEGTYGDIVQQGPFRGMKFLPGAYACCRFQKIVGSYEHELHRLLHTLISKGQYRHIVNVGAADGYFTVGLALALPEAKGVSFEMSDYSRALLERTVALNEVQDRVQVKGRCDPTLLQQLSSEIDPRKTLLICDVDGYEVELLTEGKVSWLPEADILLELHDCLRRGVTKAVLAAFSATHSITHITNAGVEYARFPMLRELTFVEIDALLNEDRRGIQDWFFMTPNPAMHEHVSHLGNQPALPHS